MKFQAYPQTKPSGVEWLGDVPEHWMVKRLRWYLRDGYDGLKIGPFGSQIRSDELSDEGFPIYGQENVISRTFDIKRRFVDEQKFQELSVYRIKPDDILVTMMGTAGRCEIAPKDFEAGIMDSHLIRLRLKQEELQHEFARLLIDESKYVAFQILLLGKGSIMHGLNSSVIKELSLLVPPPAEQWAVAAFLDRETGRIDQLVAKKRELIERLKEKRTALISRTVTRGLPPAAARAAGLPENPPIQPSGLDWLGDIPNDWKVTPLKWLTEQNRAVMYGIVLPGPNVDEGVPIVKGGDVKPGRLTVELLCKTTFEIESGYARSRLRGGDIVFSIRGTVGEAELLPDALTGANLTQDAARIAPRPETSRKWLLYVLKAHSIIDPLLSLSLGAAVRGVNIRDLKRLRIPVPPLSEQTAIAAYLDEQTAKLDALVGKVEEAVERLQEYRTALITAAVTGKIDVRGKTEEYTQ